MNERWNHFFFAFLLFIFVFQIPLLSLSSLEGTAPLFSLERSDIELHRLAQPGTYFEKAGRRFAILGYESGAFEAWAYPLKILRNFEFSFFIQTSTSPIRAKEIVRFISVTPASTTLTFTYQSFTVKAIYITAINEPGAVILLDVRTIEPLTIVCSFLAVLQPMWPAGIGGQYAYWDNKLKAYVISEPTRKNHGFVGSPAAERISYTPAHMLSDFPNQFKIVISNPKEFEGKFIPVIIAGGKGNREDIKKVYERLAANPEAYYREAVKHYRDLSDSTLRIQTPHREINLAFEWAKVAFDNLVVENPDLGRGLVAGLGPSGTGGRPGFGWFFGGDAYYNSFSISSLGMHSLVRNILSFTRRWQREDGKMAHELSQAAGYINWWKDYPYGYIHGDTTPYYIAASYDYYLKSGDTDFVRESWPSLKKAYDWCLTTDEDGDGLMDNRKAGLGALEFGALTGIQTDIYLAAIWLRACFAMEHLAKTAGDISYSKKAAECYLRGLCAFEKKFWDSENFQYSYAFNRNDELIQELTPWSALGLMWRIADPQHSIRTIERMNSAELTTDWGIRSLSARSKHYEPLNYNYGAVWPFLTGFVATAQFKHNFTIQGFQSLLTSVCHTFDNALGYVTEVFSGHQNIWPQEAVPHQGFSSTGVVLPLVRGLLGLEGDSPQKKVFFEPRFPGDWRNVSVENYSIGDAKISLRFRRDEGKIKIEVLSTKTGGFQMIFAPVLGLGTEILGAKVNGQPVPFKTETTSLAQAVQPVVEFSFSGSDVVEINFKASVEILPPRFEAKTGDDNRGMKLIRQELDGKQLRIIVEGLANHVYQLPVIGSEFVESAVGAELKAREIQIKIPEGEENEFIRHEIFLKLK